MASELNLRGVYVAAVTPFGRDGSVALEALEALVYGFLDAGAAGVVALGTTAEAAALEQGEKQAVIDVCAKACGERGAQLIVGAGTNNTAASVAAVRALEGTPALAAALSVVPYYVRPSEAGIIEHFKAVAAASPVPLVVYNIPYRTGRALGSASLLALAGVPNIAGVKQAVGSIDLDTLEVLAGAPRHGFAVLGGDDAYLYPTVLMGGAGTIAASANLATERFVAMIECGLARKLEEGRALAEALLPLVKRLFAEPNPAVIKGVLHATGKIPTPDLRLPMTAASTAAVDAALTALEKLPVTRRQGRILLAAAIWTLYVWISRLVIMAGQDESAGFKVVHAVLALVSIGFALAIGKIGWAARRAAEPGPLPARDREPVA